MLRAEEEAQSKINDPAMGLPQRKVKQSKETGRDAKSNNSKIDFEVEIINHFYVGNMSIDRDQNPSLNEYKMVQKSQNWIEYIEKGSDAQSQDKLDKSTLDTLLGLKKHY